jgi:hypothetical protein
VDQQDLVHGGFLFLSLSVVLQTSDYLGFLQTLFYHPYYFWILELFVCGLDTMFTLCPFETKMGSIFNFWIGFVFLNQSSDFCLKIAKGGVC